MGDLDEMEVARFMAEYTNRIKVCERRLEKLETIHNQIHSLSMSVHDLAKANNDMLKQMEGQAERLEKLEEQPAENWNLVMRTIITSVVSAIIGAVMAGAVM